MTTTHDDAARALVDIYAERIALTKELANSERPTGSMAQAVLDAGARLDEACEAFRRHFYPRAGRVCVGLYQVMVVSPTGRKSRSVYDGSTAIA